jgi:hypothetical protein
MLKEFESNQSAYLYVFPQREKQKTKNKKQKQKKPERVGATHPSRVRRGQRPPCGGRWASFWLGG